MNELQSDARAVVDDECAENGEDEADNYRTTWRT
jgi:hypothetical protein